MANIWLCGTGDDASNTTDALSCPSQGAGLISFPPPVWENGITFDEVLSSATDPHGLGGYQFDVTYDPNVFSPPMIVDQGVMNVGGHVTSCSMSIVVIGTVHWVCVAGPPFASGVQFTTPMVMAKVTLLPTSIIRVTIRPNKENGVATDLNDTNTEVSNTCGQPLNDGTIQPLPGQPDCQGQPLPGVGPSGLLNDSQARYTIRRLEGDVIPDCQVNLKVPADRGFEIRSEFRSAVVRQVLRREPLQFGDGEIDINDVQFVFGRLGSNCGTPNPPQPPIGLP